MKKSKIIVPALAMIGLSTVASITGTVAWFTAQRSGKITTGDFVVTKVDGNLKVLAGAGVGTTASATAHTYNDTINPTNGKQIDVSFNPLNTQLWNDRNNGSSFVTVGDDDDYQNTNPSGHPYVLSTTASNELYYAYTWTLTISMEDAATSTASMNVFFDYRNYNGSVDPTIGSKMTATRQQANGEAEEGHEYDPANETSKGFRIAIINPDIDRSTEGNQSKAIVYTYLEATDQLKCVTGESTTALYSGIAPVTNKTFAYFASDKYGFCNNAGTEKGSYSIATDGSSGQTTREDYLGNLTYANNSITLYCVAWYEGTDAQVVNNKVMEKVNTILGFYSTTVSE